MYRTNFHLLMKHETVFIKIVWDGGVPPSHR